MFDELTPFLLHWSITAVSLWVASHLFRGIRFADASSLIVSALLLGFANAIVKPILIILTLPLTFLTFGLFLLVINALMILLVAWLVRGFKVSGFWTAFFASIFVSMLSFLIGVFVLGGSSSHPIESMRSINPAPCVEGSDVIGVGSVCAVAQPVGSAMFQGRSAS